jgi:hypothetical protein
MTIPVDPPPPPATIGTQPRNADEVNGLLGTHLRGFAANKVTIIRTPRGWPSPTSKPRRTTSLTSRRPRSRAPSPIWMWLWTPWT